MFPVKETLFRVAKHAPTDMRTIDLSGKAALVTGGTRNVGWAIAQHLAEAGADVALFCRDDEFLAEVRELPARNLAAEFLRRLLNDEIKARKTNVVQSRSFAEKLEEAIRKYQNRSLEAAAILNELVEMARELREANRRGEELGLTEEVAFYDALEVNDTAVKILGDETLKTMSRELFEADKNHTTIDWTVKESLRARLRTLVKRILRKYGYPPDKQEAAAQTVLAQAEELSGQWA